VNQLWCRGSTRESVGGVAAIHVVDRAEQVRLVLWQSRMMVGKIDQRILERFCVDPITSCGGSSVVTGVFRSSPFSFAIAKERCGE